MDDLTADAIYQELSDINANVAKLVEAQNKTNEILDNLLAATRAKSPRTDD